MKVAKFMKLPTFKDKRMWLVVLFIVLVIVLFMRSSMRDGFSANMPAPRVPTFPPTINQITPMNNGVRINLTPHYMNGGSPITSFKIFTVRGGTTTQATNVTFESPTPASLGLPAGTFLSPNVAIVSGLTNGVEYGFRAKSTNAVGDSEDMSPEIKATVGGGRVPTFPPTISLITPLNNSVRINLTPHLMDGGSPVTSFKIFTVSGGTTTQATNVTFERTPGLPPTALPNVAIVSGLTNGVEYGFRAKSTNAFGDSDMSPEIKVTVGPALIPPLPPFNFSSSVSGNSVTITWSDRPQTVGASPISKYTVKVFGGTPPERQVDVPGTATSATVTNLQYGIEYRFRLSVTNENNLTATADGMITRTLTAPAGGAVGTMSGPPTAAGGPVGTMSGPPTASGVGIDSLLRQLCTYYR